jgi:hypothetical protein
MEEGVVLRRGSLVLAPSEEKITVVLVPPSVPILHQQGRQWIWKRRRGGGGWTLEAAELLKVRR